MVCIGLTPKHRTLVRTRAIILVNTLNCYACAVHIIYISTIWFEIFCVSVIVWFAVALKPQSST